MKCFQCTITKPVEPRIAMQKLSESRDKTQAPGLDLLHRSWSHHLSETHQQPCRSVIRLSNLVHSSTSSSRPKVESTLDASGVYRFYQAHEKSFTRLHTCLANVPSDCTTAEDESKLPAKHANKTRESNTHHNRIGTIDCNTELRIL